MSEYFWTERWEVPPATEGAPSTFGGRLYLAPAQRSAAGGSTAGGLLSGIDTIGGLVSGLAVLPDWVVTTNLMVCQGPLRHVGPLRLAASVLRRGRRSVVAGVTACDEGAGDVEVATALATMAVLDPGGMDLHFDRPVRTPPPPGPPDERTPEEFFAIEPGTGGVTRMVLADRLRNPWGIAHGGAVAMLVDVAARRGAAGAGLEPAVAADTVLHFLRPVRVGPAEARAEVLGSRPDGMVVRVSVHDLGAEDRQTNLASVLVRPIG